MRRLHGIGLIKRHAESGIAVTMSLDYSLTSVEIPSELVTDGDFARASEILSLVASTLHKAVSKANLALAEDFLTALGPAMASGGDHHERLLALAERLEQSIREFEDANAGVSRSPDGLVRVEVRPNGDCTVRINPHDTAQTHLEAQIRSTFNSAVRRMSRRIADSDAMSLFDTAPEGRDDADN